MSKSSTKPGRPRSDDARDAVLTAAYKLLVERGYAGMSIEAIAAEAGVGKATIYRWWNGRQEVAVDAFFAATVRELAFPETGLAREDFRQQIQQLATLLRGKRGEAMAAMLAAARTDETLQTALQSRWLTPRRAWGQKRMTQAIAAGECKPGVVTSHALELLYSPLYARLIFGRSLPDRQELDDLLALAFSAIFRET